MLGVCRKFQLSAFTKNLHVSLVFSEIFAENEQPQLKRNNRHPVKTDDDRYRTSSLRLSYNVLHGVEDLVNTLYKILDGGPFGLCWVDLSFNSISKFDDDVSPIK